MLVYFPYMDPMGMVIYSWDYEKPINEMEHKLHV